MTLDERLRRLVPDTGCSSAHRSIKSLPFRQAMPPASVEQPVLANMWDLPATAGRNSQLCRSLYHSLLEIRFFLIQKSAREFPAMAAELSGSALAGLLRQQHVGSIRIRCGNSWTSGWCLQTFGCSALYGSP